LSAERIQFVGQRGKIGGVLFLDEAYDLDPLHNPAGRAIMAEIMSAAEEHREHVNLQHMLFLLALPFITIYLFL
jgi:hypothetical protein